MNKNKYKNNNITYEEFLKFTKIKKCHYCDITIEWAAYQTGTGYHLDRKDTRQGYSVDNCVVCCSSCNWTKSDIFTYDEFMLLAPILKQIMQKRRESI